MIHFPSTIDIKIMNVLEHIFAYVCTEKGCFPKHPFSNLLHFSRKNFLLHFPFTHFCKNFLLHFPFTHFCKNFLLHFHSSHFRKIFLLHLSYTYTIKQFPPIFIPHIIILKFPTFSICLRTLTHTNIYYASNNVLFRS